MPSGKDSVLGAYLGSEIVEEVWLDRSGGACALRKMYVLSQFRSKGIGRALLAGAIEKLDEPCWCIPWIHLIHFYETSGFRRALPIDAPLVVAGRFEVYRTSGLDVALLARP